MAHYTTNTENPRSSSGSRSIEAEFFEAPGPMTEAEAKAVETFSFHVSAGHRSKHTAQKAQKAKQKPHTKTKDSDPQVSHKHETKFPAQSGPFITNSRTFKVKPKKSPLHPFSLSIGMHAVFLVCLGVKSFGVPPIKNDLEIVTSQPTLDQIEEFQDLDLDPTDSFETLETELFSDLTDANEISLENLSAESTFGELSDELSDVGEAFGDFGNVLANVDGHSVRGEDISGAGLVTFFGTKVEGNRIVYVVDNSGGMRHGELETLIVELMKSVNSLSPKQEFYVIFYSDTLYPLFYPNAPRNFVRANEHNKHLLAQWLHSVEYCLGNVVDEAIAAALSIQPDTIYLLTDGDLDGTRDQRRMEFLLNGTGGRVPIHTFGMGTGETNRAAQKLKLVAEANGGTFQSVKVNAAAKTLSQQSKRPYRNRENPGLIWGRSLGN